MKRASKATVTHSELAGFNKLRSPVWIFDIEQMQMWWANNAALNLWDALSVEELTNRDWSIISEATQTRLQNYFQQLKQGKTIVEQWTFYPQGSTVSVRCVCSGIQIESGRLLMLVEGVTDIMECIESETLRSIEALRHTTMMVSLYNLDTTPVMQNPAAIRCYGDEKNALETGSVFRKHFGDSRVFEQVRACVAAGVVFSAETQVITLNGIRWHELDVRRINDPATGQPMILVNEKDITDRKLLEQKLQEYTTQLQQSLTFEAMLKRITDKVRDSLDQSQILQTVVQELCFGLGVTCCNTALYDLEQGTSTICYEYATTNPGAQMRVAQIASFPEVYQHLLDGQHLQFCSITPNPRRGQVAMLACPILDDKGVLGDLWLINHKNHAFNELEIRLVQQVANQCAIAIRQARLYQSSLVQVEELEKLNQLKDDFLSTVSHELRTPISNMKMAIQMLKIAPTNERRERYLEILQAECTRENELISDLLDLQKLESESYAIVLHEAINLQDWLPKMIEPFESRMQESKQTLQINLSPVPPLITDRASLQRILAELLNNACKYTPASGEIVLSICYKLAEAATIFTISNPTEIPADQLPRVFEKFYRVPQGDRWQKGGTGLGLALVQKLVEQLQGTIVVESSQGCTTFTVTLPNQPKEGARDQRSEVRE
ncbi:MAG: PAS domain-containing sensor histidine kinase [Gloeocapsa sp. UFS-A4-WI-NPMV-4B04]|jgi:signal transduction histidine kinase|nr:PAS domain-containing sensor histidine kinase [Gloeocapsa sp. UFS-A4-WI-NPMV-4B04]